MIMAELETIEKKIDNMLAREDMFEERHQKGIVEDKIRREYESAFGIMLVIMIILAFASFALGYYAGDTEATRELTQKLILQRLGIFI